MDEAVWLNAAESTLRKAEDQLRILDGMCRYDGPEDVRAIGSD